MIRYELWKEYIHPDEFRKILKELKMKFKVAELPNGYIISGKYLVGVLQGGIVKQEYWHDINLPYVYDNLDAPWIVYQPDQRVKILDIRGEMVGNEVFRIIFEEERCEIWGRVAITIDPAKDTNGVEELNEFLKIWYNHDIKWNFDLLRPM